MTNKVLMGASVLAVLAAFPAFAETNVKAGAEVSTGQKIENALGKAGTKIETTAEKAADKTKAAYTDVKAYFTDDDDINVVSSVNVSTSLTADQLIGTAVQDPAGKEIGKIEDILVDADGDAEAIVIDDKGVLGLGGKKAAFDYDVMEGFAKDKDVVVKLNENSIKQAQAFDDAAMPADRYSVKKLSGAKVVDANGKAVADVETIAFTGDDADYVVVAFNQILGIGGQKAALDFDALDIVNANGKYSFKLDAAQTAQFDSHRKAEKSAN